MSSPLGTGQSPLQHLEFKLSFTKTTQNSKWDTCRSTAICESIKSSRTHQVEVAVQYTERDRMGHSPPNSTRVIPHPVGQRYYATCVGDTTWANNIGRRQRLAISLSGYPTIGSCRPPNWQHIHPGIMVYRRTSDSQMYGKSHLSTRRH